MAKKKAPVARKAKTKPKAAKKAVKKPVKAKAKVKAKPKTKVKKPARAKREPTGNSRGRPKFEVTDKVIAEVQTYAAHGFSKKAIAELLGISYETYNERAREFPDFSEAFRLGKLKGVSVATSKLFGKVKDGDLNSIKYYLNNQAKEKDLGAWSEKQEVSLTTPEGLTFINHY